MEEDSGVHLITTEDFTETIMLPLIEGIAEDTPQTTTETEVILQDFLIAQEVPIIEDKVLIIAVDLEGTIIEMEFPRVEPDLEEATTEMECLRIEADPEEHTLEEVVLLTITVTAQDLDHHLIIEEVQEHLDQEDLATAEVLDQEGVALDSEVAEALQEAVDLEVAEADLEVDQEDKKDLAYFAYNKIRIVTSAK